ncbi:DNAj-related protein scj1 [Anaeramoeba ignava]|uniref:DNAj-related protein scj1 n=1 Tax=Anaeramoeba ignava TaxID=1746090 RepID=A0A9Q0LGI2_ANAIG|nr:DNAj-related protein scj1 [Anaeramoeba ignava]|eukprot:Anaeramoba_ignava/a1170_9.p1 GENE.a1170_9~~a1170_9.p1  ORF type:complete len:320 (-),score=113.89 a1170_9:69-1028(-)
MDLFSIKFTSFFIITFFIFSVYSTKDFYELLGLTRDATETQIKKAYHSLSKIYYPDKNHAPDAEEKFVEIAEAYETLSDSKKRKLYDLYGEEGVKQGRDPNSFQTFQTFDNGFSFTFNFGGQQRQRKGADLNIDLFLDLKDFIQGKIIDIPYTKNALCTCPKGGYSCKKCKGKPLMRVDTQLHVVIEPGMNPNEEIKFDGYTDEEINTIPGDLIITIRENPDSLFQRKGMDLTTELKISLLDSLVGFKKTIRHPNGELITIEEDSITHHGMIRKYKGYGMPKRHFPSEKGSLFIRYLVDFPKSLTDEQKLRLENIFNEK